ncbi:LysR family transcriptional regulator (plasmid) [Cupriavidus necator]|uniref:LysR family transcriptional regulator n=1 Tax=Cupriavidus necator TaxID=106590 RepID=A0A367PM88_CUPNE|nr:LysR family transcriptional regulator [Cupriavidus necator]QQX89636.1 LysR family transcriptional regulator [Cupriavidus necator]RCJ09031.1 LysR family transcriptional regulator [Cupriavidus necator]
MDVRQMRYFLAVAEELNFGRAAERLHMAQPPLTRQIRALEEQIGVRLFERGNRGTELTEAGKRLLQDVPNILALTQLAEEQARLAGAGLLGRLDVGIFSAGILNVVPRLLARFHTARPEVQISLHNMTKSEQITALRERRITVAFNRLVPEEEDLVVESVLREPYLVALFEGHALCSRAAISIADLDNEPMILYPNIPLHGLAQEVAEAFRLAGARLRVEQEVEDVVTCIALVASRFGLAITTESAANLRLPGVVYKPLRDPRLRDIELSCVYRRGDTSAVLQGFLGIVRDYRNDPGVVAP